jgi:hypothetical protein
MHGLSDFIYLPLIGCCCYSSRSSKKRKKAKKAKRPVMQQHSQTQKPSFFGRLSRAHWYWASILSHRYPFLSTFSPFLCLLHSLALISSMATTRWARERKREVSVRRAFPLGQLISTGEWRRREPLTVAAQRFYIFPLLSQILGQTSGKNVSVESFQLWFSLHLVL